MAARSKKVSVRLYASGSGVVLIGMDWTPTAKQPFFGFAIRRMPGFHETIAGTARKGIQNTSSWLDNRLSFDGAPDSFSPTNVSPVQKFQWWDARFRPSEDVGKKFVYEVIPMIGRPGALVPVPGAAGSASVTFPGRSVDGVGVWFNRPFVSSQAFLRLLQRLGVDPRDPSTFTPQARTYVREWLANGLHEVVPKFAADAGKGGLSGAVYHLTDTDTIEALAQRRGKIALHWKEPSTSKSKPKSKNGTGGDVTNAAAEVRLKKAKWRVQRRQKSGNLMHNKILVGAAGASPNVVVMGSANLTSEGYSTQANVLHVWNNPGLAGLYDKRVTTLMADPAASSLHSTAGWSKPVAIGRGATAKVFFSPESARASKGQPGEPTSIQPIVDAIKKAKSSVMLCLYDPTDAYLMDAVMDAISRNKAVFGLLNSLPTTEPSPTTKSGARTPAYAVKKKLYDFTRRHTELVAAQGYLNTPPMGWMQELFALPWSGHPVGKKKQSTGPAKSSGDRFVFDPATVRVHHKFVLIDGETEHPILFTGSANLSKNSSTKNDENTLWIEGHHHLARTYLAEFMRVFEHYRFRHVEKTHKTKASRGTARRTLRLDRTGKKWWPKYLVPSPRATARKSFAS